MCSPFALPCVALSYAHTVRKGKEKNETRETNMKPGSRQTQKKTGKHKASMQDTAHL